MKLSSTLLAGLLLVPAAFPQGQGAPAPAAATPSKIGVISVRQGIVNTAEGKQASATLQSQFAPRQTELDNLRKQIEDAQKRGQAGINTMPDEDKARLARQIEAWSRRFDRMRTELQEDLQTAENEVGETIGRKMMEIVDRYARENGFAVVFDVSAQTTPVVYASNQVDITQDIIRLYDQAHPIAAPAPRPAAAQPGQPRPTKPPQK